MLQRQPQPRSTDPYSTSSSGSGSGSGSGSRNHPTSTSSSRATPTNAPPPLLPPPPLRTSSRHYSSQHFMTSTILCFVLCSIVMVILDYHLEQSIRHHVALVVVTTSSSSSTSTTSSTTTPSSFSSSSSSSSSPLNDPTLLWDNEQYPHAWLAYEQPHKPNTVPKPPYMILLTEYGWNHPNPKRGLTFARCLRSTEFVQSIIHHPYFHPTAYHDIMITQTRRVDPNMTYYIFLDVETCYESNYPHYGKSYYGNCDTSGPVDLLSSSSSSSSSSIRRQSSSLHRSAYQSWYIKYFHPRTSTCYDFHNCHYVQKELQHNPLFRTSRLEASVPNDTTTTTMDQKKSKNRLIVLDCRGNGQTASFRRHPVTPNASSSSSSSWGHDPHLVMVSLSSTISQLNFTLGDQGLPPPVLQPIPYQYDSSTTATSIRRSDIHTTTITTTTTNPIKRTTTTTSQYQYEIILDHCNDDDNNNNNNNNNNSSTLQQYRKYLLSFSGDYHRHPVRQQLAQLDTVRSSSHRNKNNDSRRSNTTSFTAAVSSSFSDDDDVPLVLITDTKDLYEHTNGMTYPELLLSSQFVAVPRGDNLYSYRFSEVLSSGAIPVLIHNQEWVLPFRHEIVQWERCVVWINVEQIPETISILQNISISEQCQRRQYCYSIYERYMKNSSATIQGILDGLQAMVDVV